MRRKPTPSLESLARSIAPESHHYGKGRSSSNDECIVRERELIPPVLNAFRGNERLQRASIENFRSKIGKSNDSHSPKGELEDILEGERKRLKRARSPVLIMEDKSVSMNRSRSSGGGNRDEGGEREFDRRYEMNKRLSLAIRMKQREQT